MSTPFPSSTPSSSSMIIPVAVSGEPPCSSTPGQLQRSRSAVWSHFTDTDNPDFPGSAQCRYCGKRVKGVRGSTGNLHRHLKQHEGLPRLQAEQSPGSLPPAITISALRDRLTDLIIMNTLPFTLVDKDAFRAFVTYLNPYATIPSAATIKRCIETRYVAEKARVANLLRQTPGKISISVDCWSSPAMKSFIGITCHFINSDWKLISTLLDIRGFGGDHSGENISACVLESLDDFRIAHKLLAVVTDNASNNDTFLRTLADELHKRGIDFDCENHRVRCIDHILNLAAQSFLKKLRSRPPTDEQIETTNPNNVDSSCSVIPKLRRLVCTFRSSPQRKALLARHVKDGPKV